jgi:hypothetical protein
MLQMRLRAMVLRAHRSGFMKKFATALALCSLVALSPAFSAPCKDAKGKFTKCPPKTAPVKKGPCRDTKGKFIKCK